jgi:Uma2 family endonuclease
MVEAKKELVRAWLTKASHDLKAARLLAMQREVKMPTMATATQAWSSLQVDGQRFLWYGIGWKGYERLLELVGDRPIRLTYDRGNLEIMSPLGVHERCKYLFGRIIDAVTEELDIPVMAAASTTFRREDVDRGLEPYQCYYFESAARIRDPGKLHLDVDPPPDLAFEVDIVRSRLDRIGIYAALGIPEVWSFDGESLFILKLQAGGAYAPAEVSGILPFLSPADVARFLRDYDQKNDTRWGRALRAWVREELAPRVRNV